SADVAGEAVQTERGPQAASSNTDSGPYTRLTFEQFVTGTSNRFSHAAALAVAETPAGAYNPLFIHGDSGLGKTHLLRAICHYVNHHYPSYKVRYVTSETFLNEFVQAIRNSTQPEFKQVYRSNDVLLVDDIQFMEGKDGLQEEFFHTFNDLLQNGAQIVLSSDRGPDAMPTLEDRLRSRFKSGLITDIQPPDLVTRLAILEKKAEFSAIEIPGDVLSFIAENVTDSIRELEGALIRVTAYASITGQRCSYDLAKRVLADLIDNTTQRRRHREIDSQGHVGECSTSRWIRSQAAAGVGR
ncbi:Chromosomal replication initiator protein DnaA, partial [Geodia barretti]